MSSLLQRLVNGDMRTTGAAEEIVKEVGGNAILFNELFEGLTDTNPGVRMRSADALEKISQKQPGLLLPHKGALIKIAFESTQQEVQWHTAQMLGYLRLNEKEQK